MATYEKLEEVNKTLNTIDVKGKDYIAVNERIKAFRMLYPEGIIDTNLISDIDGVCTFKAQVGYYEEDGCVRWLGTGYAQEKENSSFINKTSYIENCETSAVGRALGMAGFGINTSIASAEEVLNAINNQTMTIEDAKKYELTFGKHIGKTLEEVNNEAPDYIEWLVKNSKDNIVLTTIDLLFNMKKEDYNVTDDVLQLQNDIMTLVDELGADLEAIKNSYKIDSLNKADRKTLDNIYARLIKAKETRTKLQSE